MSYREENGQVILTMSREHYANLMITFGLAMAAHDNGGILFGVAAIALIAWLQAQLLIAMYRRGYQRGRKDASDWWTQVAKDVEQMGQQIKDEERWP